jgi:hypothetical protein
VRLSSIALPGRFSSALSRWTARALTLGSFVILGQTPLQAQTADGYVNQGRAFLVAHNLTNANAQFAAALALSPNHETGNVFYAATRLLTLPTTPSGKAFLDRLGFATTNRDVYHWTHGQGTNAIGVNLMAIRIATITPAATPAAVRMRLSVSGSMEQSLAVSRPLMRDHLLCAAASAVGALGLRLVLRR